MTNEKILKHLKIVDLRKLLWYFIINKRKNEKRRKNLC